jgi:hypothetical protein
LILVLSFAESRRLGGGRRLLSIPPFVEEDDMATRNSEESKLIIDEVRM